MIVGIVPTYREGPLAAGAIRSLLKCCAVVLVYEGPIAGAPDTGDATDLSAFKKEQRVMVKYGSWDNEIHKRNDMLNATRRYPAPTWGVYLDADEILTDAEYVPDLIYAATVTTREGETPASIPVLIQEVDSSVGRVHRIFRLDLLEKHVLSMSQFKFSTSALTVTLPLIPVWRPGQAIDETHRPPMQGEPSIHHRSYYRPPKRGDYRLHKSEGEDFLELERSALERLGIKPEHTPGEIPGTAT